MKYLIAIGIIIITFYFFVRKKKGLKSKEQSLRREYIRRAGLPPTTADEHIDSFIRHLQEKHPGRSDEWCLEKMLYDLERQKQLKGDRENYAGELVKKSDP